MISRDFMTDDKRAEIALGLTTIIFGGTQDSARSAEDVLRVYGACLAVVDGEGVLTAMMEHGV